MGEEIKSAWEIAMEKVERLGSVTEEERLEWKYVPEGEKLAAQYLKQEINLITEVSRYEKKAGKYVVKGAGEILARYITLPTDDMAKSNNKKAF